MADIFIGYARHDRDIVERLAAAVEVAGYSVWWDRQIVGGAEFSRDIERELNAASAAIIVWSEHSSQSPWVKDEAGVARDQDKLVPVSLNSDPPPLGFRQYQAIDFSAWKGQQNSQEMERLVRAIESRLSGTDLTDVEISSPAPQSRKKNRLPLAAMLIIAAAAGIAYFGFSAKNPQIGPQAFEPENASGATAASYQDVDSLPRIQVSPIKVREENAELKNLAAALTEDIASGLSRFSYFLVESGEHNASENTTAQRYVLQGTLRQSGLTLRLTTQLKDNRNGEQVWGETFDRVYDPDAILGIQDDLTDNVVASVADPYGALMRDLASGVGLIPAEDMTPYQAVLRHFIYRQRIGAEDHLATRNALEHALEIAPGNADLHAAVAAIYSEEYKHGYNVLPQSLDRALAAARTAVELEPDNAYANFILSEVHFFRQELGAFRATADRAIELNPRDSDAMAMTGILMGYAGDWDRGEELTRRAIALNPNHPGWYYFSLFFNAYRLENYELALSIAEKINMPDYFADPYSRAIALAQLGRIEQAQIAYQEFRRLWPELTIESFTHEHLNKWFFAQPALIVQIIEGLQKTGLQDDSRA